MKSIDNGDGPNMTVLEMAQDILANRNDDRCFINKHYSRIICKRVVELEDLLRWRKCGEEMPENDELVLATDSDFEGIELASWSNGAGLWCGAGGELHKRDWYTHWRPIGPLPEGGEG